MSKKSATGTSKTRIDLRDLFEGDLSVLYEHQCDPSAAEMAAFAPRDRDAFLDHWQKILIDPSIPAMAIVCDGCVAGYVLSWEQGGKRLVGYWVGSVHWGKGIATRALSAYLRVVTRRPVYAYVAKHNIASIRVLEKCGFVVSIPETESLPPPTDGVEELVFKLSACDSPE